MAQRDNINSLTCSAAHVKPEVEEAGGGGMPLTSLAARHSHPFFPFVSEPRHQLQFARPSAVHGCIYRGIDLTKEYKRQARLHSCTIGDFLPRLVQQQQKQQQKRQTQRQRQRHRQHRKAEPIALTTPSL